MDTVNEIIVSGLDQTLPIRRAEHDLLERVDRIVEESVEKNDPERGFDAMESLLGMNRASGKALAKFIYTYIHVWEKFGSQFTFESVAEERLGLQKVTVQRYFRVWKLLVETEMPREYREKLQLLPMRSLVPIANLVEQGYELEDRDWLKLANAPDVATVNAIIREIKGVEPKANSLQMEWDIASKTLTAWKNGRPHEIYFTFDENDPTVLQALERLFGSGKVMVK